MHCSFLQGRYDVAMDINTLGARNLMSFAKRCKKVKLFLQVSTGKYQKTDKKAMNKMP